MFRFRRAAWRSLEDSRRQALASELVESLARLESPADGGHPDQSAVFSQLGHKGDLILVHFRDSVEELHRVELALAQLEFSDYLEATHSYLSVVELGLYESSAKTYGQLSERGLEPHSPEWDAGVAEVAARQAAAM